MTARFQTGARMTELIVVCDVANNNVFSYHQNKQLGESVVFSSPESGMLFRQYANWT